LLWWVSAHLVLLRGGGFFVPLYQRVYTLPNGGDEG
jgi:hypothetical protein